MCQGTLLLSFNVLFLITGFFVLAQIEGGSYGVEVDLFGFAITAVEILIWELVYPSELADEIVSSEVVNTELTVLRVKDIVKSIASVAKLQGILDLLCELILMKHHNLKSLISFIETLFALVPHCDY